MRTAIDKVGRGKERDVNVRFQAMASHYLFEPEFCNPASGWEKGQVEKNVQDARHRLWQPTPRFPSLDALNDWLEQRCKEFWAQTPHGQMRGSIADIWAEEAPALMPIARPFDGFVEYTKRVSPTCLVHLERNRYSVPASFANRPVSLRVYPDRVVVAAEGQIVCEHRRVIDRSHDRPGQTIYDWRHYLAVVQRKPGALRNGAPFAELPDAFRTLQQYLLPVPAISLSPSSKTIRRAVCGVTSSVFAKIPADTDGFSITSSTNSGNLEEVRRPSNFRSKACALATVGHALCLRSRTT